MQSRPTGVGAIDEMAFDTSAAAAAAAVVAVAGKQVSIVHMVLKR